MEVRIASEFNKILDLLKFFLTLLNVKVHSNLSLSYGFEETKILFVMTKIFIIFNSKFTENNFMLLTLYFVISFIFICDIKSFC